MMGASFALCCCLNCLKSNREEKKAILRLSSSSAPKRVQHVTSESSNSDTEEESLFGPPGLKRSPWNNRQSQTKTLLLKACPGYLCEPGSRRGSDRELQDFINMRDQADEATEEWEKLNFDIYTLRYTKKEVRSRWKKILLQLGYQCEVESLLDVNKQSRFRREQEHHSKAMELLKQLLEHTSLFPPGTEHRNRYLHVMDRLVSLDSAEDFLRLAKEKYPKKVE